ncbi:MAG: molybdate ABC transporter substrate-binding protein [Dehalococcoidales bacterium]|nr:molybdate ABC transporter substrate-binding protein [Dehalococcoidales bacterium]
MIKKLTKIIACLIAIMMIMPLTACTDNEEGDITLNISASSVLTDALAEVNDLYMQKNSDIKILSNFTSAGTIQSQIENGADCDVFFSANVRNMDNLENKGLIISDSRENVLSNMLVLIVPASSSKGIDTFTDLIKDNIELVAIGDTSTVSAGIYSEKLFKLLEIYDQLSPKFISASNVREVLSYVETGNVDAGLVFMSDALTSDSVVIVDTAPDEINSQIVMTAAVVAASKYVEAAKEYLTFLSGAEAMAIFEKYGFSAAVE